MYIYITESLCYTPETNTILKINYTSILKKKKILPFATTWTALEGIMLSEVRQRQIYMISFICRI